jgi:hypothetical protein
MQLNGLNVDDSFEIRKFNFAYRVFQINRYNRIYNSISKKIIEIRFKFFERKMEAGNEFKYKNTGDINIK